MKIIITIIIILLSLSLEANNSLKSINNSLTTNIEKSNDNNANTTSQGHARSKATIKKNNVTEGQVLKARLRGRTELTLSAWTNLYDQKYMKNNTKLDSKLLKKKSESKIVEPPPLTLRQKISEISKIYKSKKRIKQNVNYRNNRFNNDSHNDNNNNNNNDNNNYGYKNEIESNEDYIYEYDNNNYQYFDDNSNKDLDHDGDDDEQFITNNDNEQYIDDYVTYQSNNDFNTLVHDDDTDNFGFGPTIVHKLPVV